MPRATYAGRPTQRARIRKLLATFSAVNSHQVAAVLGVPIAQASAQLAQLTRKGELRTRPVLSRPYRTEYQRAGVQA